MSPPLLKKQKQGTSYYGKLFELKLYALLSASNP